MDYLFPSRARARRALHSITVGLIASCLAPSSLQAQLCPGDCNEDGTVSIAELAAGVALTLASADSAGHSFGMPDREACAAIDQDADLIVTIDELLRAVDLALNGCPFDVGFCSDRAEEVERRVTKLIHQMTLEEKIMQMHGLQGTPIDGLYYTPGNPRLGVPGLRMVDGPRGVRAGHATAFPVAMARGATWDPSLEERVGDAIGRETRAKGASVLLAPCINLLRHPRWGRAQETYGEDPLQLGRLGTGFVKGAQRHVIASAKHFALNSIEDRRNTVNVMVDERTLRELYLPHFRMVVQEGHVGSVMTAYNRVNGLYCSENDTLLRDILKGEWGFAGFVESDWFFGVRSTTGAALAGLDIEMPQAGWYGTALLAAVESGAVPESVINEAVRRILRTTLCFGLDSDPPVLDPEMVESAEHTALAREVAEKAIVLLRNEGSLLPLDPTDLSAVAVVGPLADRANLGDVGSSNVSPSYVVTPLAGIRELAPAADITHVADLPFSDADRERIAEADVAVVVVGLTAQDEGEDLIIVGGDRPFMGLPRNQDVLISTVAALNPRVVVVLEGGSAITMDGWIDEAAAILMAWYPGQEGGRAIANVLFGARNPSAKLPISFPRAETDLPPFVNDRDEVVYDYYHGYRHLDRMQTEPLFPFGFGLSYTNFGYENLALSSDTTNEDGSVEVAFDVVNTGSIAGDEIAQVYVGYQGSRVDRAVRDLRAFTKISLGPGERERVNIELRAADLAFYDPSASRWEVEPITYTVHVGPSSRDLPLNASFNVSG